MWQEWIFSSWPEVGLAVFTVAVVYTAIIFYVRVTGLRSFSKMSASDFAMTLAVGSLFGTAVASKEPPLLLTLAVLAALFAGKWFFTALRSMAKAESVLDNQPLLLMHGENILDENMRTANVTRADLIAKLREANVVRMSQVLAVVFETTGDISVLHAERSDEHLEPVLLEGVVGRQRFETSADSDATR